MMNRAFFLFATLIPWMAHAELRGGAATTKITPPLGIPLAGYYHRRGSESIHDDLYARAMVLEQEGVKVAMVALDLISTRRGFVEEARVEIEKRTGIPAHHVMISATHAHSGPVLSGSKLYDEQGGQEPPALAFTRDLPSKIAESVALANTQMTSVELLGAVGHEESIAFHRRFHMKDGTVGWNPGKLNPNILKPVGPIDPQVPVVYLRALEERRPIAVYVNHAVHLDNVGGPRISADLPFTLTENLKAAVGKDLVTLYTSGACGDLNHVDVTWKEPQKGPENAARMGTILAGEVLRTWRHLQPIEGILQMKSRMVSLELPKVSEDAVEKAKLLLGSSARDNTRASFMPLVFAHKVLDVAHREGKPFEVEVQVITLGNALAWVALPGEIFVELGLELGQTMVVELANGSIGYVPTRRAYRQGAYEVVSARVAEGSGEKLVHAALDLLAEAFAVARPK